MYTPRPTMPGRVVLAVVMITFLAGAAILALFRAIADGWYVGVPGTAGMMLASLGLVAGVAAIRFRAGSDVPRRVALISCVVLAIVTGGTGVIALVLTTTSHNGLERAVALIFCLFALGLAVAAITASMALTSHQAREWFAWDGGLLPEQPEWRPTRLVPAVMIATGVLGLIALVLSWVVAPFSLDFDTLGVVTALLVGAMAVPVTVGTSAARVTALTAAAVGTLIWGLSALVALLALATPGEITDGPELSAVGLALLNLATVVLLARRTGPPSPPRASLGDRIPTKGGPMTVRATWNGALLAESDDTVIVEGNHYFPPDSVEREYLTESETHTICGWKGTASYYTVVVDGESNEDAAWYYPETKPEADKVKGYVAFWKGVEITEV